MQRGWKIAVGLIFAGSLVAIVSLRLLLGRDAFCATTAEEHCLREWIAASSGWAAVAVAIPTVLYLSKQISDAERHFSLSQRNEIREWIALSYQVHAASRNVKSVIISWYRKITSLDKTEKNFYLYKSSFVKIKDIFDRGVFSNFELRVGFPEGDNSITAQAWLHEAAIRIEKIETTGVAATEDREWSEAMRFGRDAIVHIDGYLNRIGFQATKFLEECSSANLAPK